MYDATLLSQEGGLLQVGSNCMIAQSAELRNSDSHTIRDASTGERINPPADVIVGDRVWIGLHSMVFKGSRIGSGTVIAAKSLVTGDIPAGCIALGTPAKPVRSGINWERPRATSAEAQSRLRK
jgi:acetyltransferase-like isoleucine patch superfamily enzyme